MWLSLTATFLWNFTDLFIILISSALAAQFRKLTKAMHNVRGQVSICAPLIIIVIPIKSSTYYIWGGELTVSEIFKILYFICVGILIDVDNVAVARIPRDIYVPDPLGKEN